MLTQNHDTTSTLLTRAMMAAMKEDYDLALELLDSVAVRVEILETHAFYTGRCTKCLERKQDCECQR